MSNAPRYSNEELQDLHDLHCKLVAECILNHSTPGAFWQKQYGHLAKHPVAEILLLVEHIEAAEHTFSDMPLCHYQALGKVVGAAIRSNDHSLFRILTIALEARAQGRALASLSPKDLGLKLARGRPKSPRDLSRVFPLALMMVTGRRSEFHSKLAPFSPFTDARITREEVRDEVLRLDGSISTSEMSRHLTGNDFNRFMAEQPIARKPSE